MVGRAFDDKLSDTLVVVSGEGFWTGSSTLPHLHHFFCLAARRRRRCGNSGTPIRLATRWFLFSATAMALISVVGCQASAADPGLKVGGDPRPAIVSAGNVVGGEPVSFGSIILCLGAPGSATIRDVSLMGSTGSIHLDKFAIRPNPYVRQQQGVGAERSDLAALGFSASTAQVVDTQCPKPGAEATWQGGSELAFQVSYDGKGTAGSQSLNVTYEYGPGTTKAFSISYGVRLCPTQCADPTAATSGTSG